MGKKFYKKYNALTGKMDIYFYETADYQVLAGSEISFANHYHLEKELTEDTTFTFTDLEIGKDVLIKIKGDWFHDLTGSTKFDGSKYYNPDIWNYYLISCISLTEIRHTILHALE